MDTTLKLRLKLEKSTSYVAGIVIVLCLLITQNLIIVAKDLGIGSYTGLSPTLNYIIEAEAEKERIFNEKLAFKYINSNVAEVEKGVKHVRMIRFYNNRPVRINIVELSQNVNHNLQIEPAIASNTLASRKKISNIAERDGAIVAINGGYFKPQTGVPLGTLMINKKIFTGPIYDRVAMGFFEEGYGMARIQFKSKINTNIGGIKIDNINQPRMLSTHTIVYTRDWGETTPNTPKYGTQLVIEKGKLIQNSANSVKIPEKGFVIVGPEQKLKPFIEAKNFELDLKMNPEWKNVNHIISGGPYLVKGGEVYVDMTAQKLSAIGGRNPRTAIGYTKDNHLILITADGREGSSIGLTLMELAHLMKELGCINAMNLDGGGSTVMYIKGKVVNRPQTSGGIPLSHTLNISLKKS